jgi:hypothetical protein
MILCPHSRRSDARPDTCSQCLLDSACITRAPMRMPTWARDTRGPIKVLRDNLRMHRDRLE